MIIVLTELLIGFSVLSAAILLVAYLFFIKGMRKSAISMIACTILLTALAVLQLWHWHFLQTGFDLFSSRAYAVVLLTVPPTLYFFSREILLPETRAVFSDLVHLSPLTLGFVMPVDLIVPVALIVGVGYSIWLVKIVVGLKRPVRRFKFELFFFGFFAIFAVLVLILAIAGSRLEPAVFFIAYANTTGLALVLIVSALVGFPELLTDLSAAAELAYSSSTLKSVDVQDKLRDLERLMVDDKMYQNENLNLNLLAEAVELSHHQLSELINTQFGVGFSRYIRELRIDAAKALLRADKTSSILSISLMTGFKSQSNFYAAFREVTGQSPGSFRKPLDGDPLDS